MTVLRRHVHEDNEEPEVQEQRVCREAEAHCVVSAQEAAGVQRGEVKQVRSLTDTQAAPLWSSAACESVKPDLPLTFSTSTSTTLPAESAANGRTGPAANCCSGNACSKRSVIF